MAERVESQASVIRSLSAPVAALVAIVVAAAWYVTWATSDFAMAFVDPMATPAEVDVAMFFALLVVMMIAMMLPSALPMILAYRGLTRLEAGRPVQPADNLGTALFVAPYFLVWGAFGIAALLGLVALGFIDPMGGPLALASSVVLVAAGVYQATRAKEVCLIRCQSPMSFVMQHWRSGRTGAVRMGLRHAAYCIGCCWLFMIVLFVAGAMSLVWMGVLSVAIFVEKMTARPRPVSLTIGGLLIGLGVLLAVQALLSG